MSLGAAGLGQRSGEGRRESFGDGQYRGGDLQGQTECAGRSQTDRRTRAKPERNERSRTVRERGREGGLGKLSE